MSTGGFAGKILWVDLTKGITKQEPLDMALAEEFIGGLGLCIKLCSDAIEPGCDRFRRKTPSSLERGRGGHQPSIDIPRVRGFQAARDGHHRLVRRRRIHIRSDAQERRVLTT